MKVLALSAHPIESAATRYRLSQYIEPLAGRGIELRVRPFMNSELFGALYDRRKLLRVTTGLIKAVLKRVVDPIAAFDADLLLVQREAMIFGPPVIEWLTLRLGRCPMVLDLDDAMNIRYVSPTYGRFAARLKCVWKTDALIAWSRIVTCGNRYIADYARSKGASATVIPTVVDTTKFIPQSREGGSCPVVGWIGTHSTYPFLESVIPALERAAKKCRFRLRVIGGKVPPPIAGVEVDALPWTLEREVSDFQALDIGLYPIDSRTYGAEWVAGKSGFKAIQYMSIGIPFIVTPVGVCSEVGIDGVTHFAATSTDEWSEALERLLGDAALRRRMGEAGRQHAIERYSLPQQAQLFADTLLQAADQ